MYTLATKKNQYVISSSPLSPYTLFCDREQWETFGEDDLADHFEAIQALLLERITQLQDSLHILLPHEEKELQFMLEALMQAKRTLQDRP